MKNRLKLAIFGSIGLSFAGWAQSVNEAATQASSWSPETLWVIILGSIAFVLLLIVTFMLLQIYVYVLNEDREKQGLPVFSLGKMLLNRIDENFVNGKISPVEQEEAFLLPHAYDGIQELNNGMPTWLRFIFTFTIAVGIGYMTYYYVLEAGELQDDEYKTEMALATAEVDAYNKKVANSIDENSVQKSSDPTLLADGKLIYDQNCIAYHGALGEGGVGPNLTDAYWLHGGSIQAVFKTISNGIPEKGMIAWKQKLRLVDIQNVSNYILSMQGSNPPNGKEPQGEKEM